MLGKCLISFIQASSPILEESKAQMVATLINKEMIFVVILAEMEDKIYARQWLIERNLM